MERTTSSAASDDGAEEVLDEEPFEAEPYGADYIDDPEETDEDD